MQQGYWKYPAMTGDMAKLELVILEQRLEKNFVKYFLDEYRNDGYTIYNEKERIPLEYRFKIEYGEKSVFVVAVNKRKEKVRLGTYRKFKDAQRFLRYITKNNPANSLVYSIEHYSP